MNLRAGPFTEGETLAFPHVGGRRYVRGLDVVALIERRCPDFASLELKFLRPISNHTAISSRREHGAAVSVSLKQREGTPLDLYIVNLPGAGAPSESEVRLAPHIALPGNSTRHRYVVFGQRSHSEILAVVFSRYQVATGRRFLLRTLRLQRRRSAPLELVSLTEPKIEHGLSTCSISRQGKTWCRIEMVDAETAS